ncbi:MAG: AraC family transcriptional regulator [Bilophila wadsworthia]
MMETGSGETARTASLLKEKLLQRAPEHGKYPMDIEGLVITRRHEANRIETCFSKPSVSVIIQGSKRTMLGSEEYCYGENQCLVAGVDMPSSFYVTDASPERPFLALCLDLDKYLITRLAAEVPPPCATGACSYKGLSVADVDPDILHAFLRLVELLEKPEQSPYWAAIVREIHYRLFIGPRGIPAPTEHPRHPEQSDRPSHHVAAGQLQGTFAGRQAGSEGKHGHLHVPPPF